MGCKVFVRRTAAVIVTFVIVIATWSLLVHMLDINPVILPGPGAVLAALMENWRPLVVNTGVTMGEAVLGFAVGSIAAYIVAVVFVRWAPVRNGLYPYAIALKSTPLIAIAPVLTMWFGDGMLAK